MAEPTTATELLKSIDATLKALLALSQQQRSVTASSSEPEVADDATLDGQYGDDEVKFNPRGWQGAAIKGLKMSQCKPDALDALASALDYFCEKNKASGELKENGYPKWKDDARRAAKARGWARRLRAGWKPAEAPASDFGDTQSF